MSEATARAAVYAAVNGVSNVGNVYDYARQTDTWDEFLALFKTEISGVAQIRGFMVELQSIDPVFQEFAPRGIRSYPFRIRGLLRVNDKSASEKTFTALVEAVLNALDNDATLHDGQTFYLTTQAAAQPIEYRVFGQVLCHTVEIRVEVQEFIA